MHDWLGEGSTKFGGECHPGVIAGCAPDISIVVPTVDDPKVWSSSGARSDGMSGNGYSLWVLPRKVRGTAKDGACDKSLKQPKPSMSGGMRVDQQYPVGEERCRGSPKISLEHVIIYNSDI